MKEKRYLLEPIVVSHVLYIINAALWLSEGYYLCAFFVLASALVSTAHHLTRESKLTILNRVFAWSALNATVVFSITKLEILHWLSLAACMSLGLSLKEEANRGLSFEGYHTAWHISVFAGQYILYSAVT